MLVALYLFFFLVTDALYHIVTLFHVYLINKQYFSSCACIAIYGYILIQMLTINNKYKFITSASSSSKSKLLKWRFRFGCRDFSLVYECCPRLEKVGFVSHKWLFFLFVLFCLFLFVCFFFFNMVVIQFHKREEKWCFL